MCLLSPEAARKKACVCSRHGRPCSMPNPQDARNTPRMHAQLPCTSKPFDLHVKFNNCHWLVICWFIR